jgi:hypothetical protein
MYRVEPIGAVFTGKGHEQLGLSLSRYEDDGWELVAVFPVHVSGCLGRTSQTNYMVLRKANRPSN